MLYSIVDNINTTSLQDGYGRSAKGKASKFFSICVSIVFLSIAVGVLCSHYNRQRFSRRIYRNDRSFCWVIWRNITIQWSNKTQSKIRSWWVCSNVTIFNRNCALVMERSISMMNIILGGVVTLALSLCGFTFYLLAQLPQGFQGL